MTVSTESSEWVDDEEAAAPTTTDHNNMDIDFLFEEVEKDEKEKHVPMDAQEKVWRFAKKILLHIGSKGANHSHGNSLRQLLEDHTVVKVKVNTKKFGSLEKAATTLKELAVENGAPKDIEVIQMREYGKTILFGVPGTLERMEKGKFPPPPPPPPSDKDADGTNMAAP